MKKIVIKAIALVCLSSMTFNAPVLYALEGVSTYANAVYDGDIIFTIDTVKDADNNALKYQYGTFNGKVTFSPEIVDASKFVNGIFYWAKFNDFVTIPSTFKNVQLKSNMTYNTNGIFHYATLNKDIIIEEGVEVIRSATFQHTKFKTDYLRLPDSITEVSERGIEYAEFKTISLGPNIQRFEDLYSVKYLEKIEFREGCKDFYIFNDLYYVPTAKLQAAFYLPRSMDPYSSSFFKEVFPYKAAPTDPVQIFNFVKNDYSIMPYVWEGSKIQQYFDENGITYKLRDANDPEDPANMPLPGEEETKEDVDGGEGDLDKEENEDGENNGDGSQKPGQTPGSDDSNNGNVSGDTIIVDGNIFESEEEVKVVPATPGLKRVGPTLEVYKALLKEVDSSANNRSLRRVSNFINRFGSSFSLLFRR